LNPSFYQSGWKLGVQIGYDILCGWYLDDMWVIWNVDDIVQISSTFHPDSIQISSTYHPDIIHISSRYHPHIVQISYFTTPQLGEKSSFNPYMARLLPTKTPLLNSIKTPLLSSRYYPNIIQKSSRNHPDIIQKSSRNHLGEKSSFNPCMARL